METQKENIAPTPATSQLGLAPGATMTEDQFERERRYQASMNLFRSMLKTNLITTEQYEVIDTKMLEKYRPLFGTLLVEDSLTI